MVSEQRKGELAAGGAALLWGLFPVVTVITVSAIAPLFAAAIGTEFGALFFACVLTWRGHWTQLRRKDAWRDMLLATLFIGIIFYGLVFTGYRFTSPGNGALVALMEVFFTFVIVNLLWKHEHFVWLHGVGSLCMIVGAALILLPKSSEQWNIGDLLIMLATAFAPIGNIYAQRARKIVSADTLMFVRSSISGVFLFALACFIEPVPTSATLTQSLPLLLLSGVFLMGLSKILWLEAIHRLPIAKTIALTEIEAPLTLFFAYLFLGQNVTQIQALSIVPMLLGVFLLTRK